jgi:putative membrane protein
MAEGDGGRKAGAEEYKLRLQLETSLLVWVRTSLALMGFGFVVARFGLFLREVAEVAEVKLRAHPRLARVSSLGGTGLIVLGVVVLVLALWGHQAEVRRLERGELGLPPRWSLAATLSVVLAALGMTLAAYLASVEF